ncbi:MAG TPA: PQQ-binding-like beta-propeller repeat protein [Gemmataceae bacterium]
MRKYLPAALLTLVWAASSPAEESNWPRWRGPDDSGSTPYGTYCVRWGPTENILWKAPLPGLGCSTPIVWGDLIIVTCADGDDDAVIAFDWAGREKWRATIGPQVRGKHRNGSGSNPSPVTDGEHVFVYYKSGNLAGLDLSGKVLWKTNLQKRYGRSTLYWDVGTSPVLTERDVVIAVMHEGGSYVAAFEKKTGELSWKVDRNYKTPREGDHSYATPVVVNHNGREVILVWGAEHVTAHDAADGKLLWECGEFNPKQIRNQPSVASPVVAGDVAVIPYGRTGRGGTVELTGVRLGGEGNVTKTHQVWKRSGVGAFVPSPAVAGGRVFSLSDEGEVVCLDAKSGGTIWKGAFPRSGGAKFYASPVVADGKLYAVREDGIAFVASADKDFKLLAENEMGERVIASPVPVRDRLLIRGEKHLYCIGK